MTHSKATKPLVHPHNALTPFHFHNIHQEYRTLWCLFLGDKEPFKVALPLNVDVDDLKELIHIKGIDTTKSTVLAKDLILWRVRVLFEQF